MCTVTFIPKGKDDFILTTNRDENAARSPKNITLVEQHGQRLVFPRDTEAGGTWIAVSDSNRVICVLNGAFERHVRRPPYSRSRGIMALDFFGFPTASGFFSDYDFKGMESFTMVVYDNGHIYDLRWDEEQLHLTELSTNEPHIWSSATLYEPSVRSKRERWFNHWLEKYEEYNLDTIMDFHHNAGDGDPWNDVVMNRNGMVQTVSITNIVKRPSKIEMRYYDLLNEDLKQAKIDLRGEVVESR